MPFVLLVHGDDPMAERQRVDLRRLADAQVISIGEPSSTSEYINAHLRDRGLELTPAHTVDTEGTAILFVELGLGQAVLPAAQGLAVAERYHLRALPIRGLPPIHWGWVARDFGLLSSAAREFLSLFDDAQAAG